VSTLAPLPVFELIGDLSVNTGKWMRHMSERLETWVHTRSGDVDLTRIEEAMEPELAEQIYLLDRCIECGCCVAACGTARMREDFRRRRGPQPHRALPARPARYARRRRLLRADRDDQGVFGCMSLLACHDLCPKDLPLQTQIAFLRRKMVVAGLK
jgi:fumarate reductase iron-sulfur subunit